MSSLLSTWKEVIPKRLRWKEVSALLMHEMPTSTPSDSLSTESPQRGRAAVIAGCIAGMLMFIAAISVLFLTWAHNDNPSCLLTVIGAENLAEAEVTLSPVTGAMRQPLIAKMKEGDENHLRFHVPPGMYRISVRDERGKVLFVPANYELKSGSPMFITLHDPPASQPTTRGSH